METLRKPLFTVIPTKKLKRSMRPDESPMSLKIFSLVNTSDRLVINNPKKAVKDNLNRYRLVYKCLSCNKIGHLTKNCNLKAKPCHKCNSANCSGKCSKAN